MIANNRRQILNSKSSHNKLKSFKIQLKVRVKKKTQLKIIEKTI